MNRPVFDCVVCDVIGAVDANASTLAVAPIVSDTIEKSLVIISFSNRCLVLGMGLDLRGWEWAWTFEMLVVVMGR